MLIKRLSLKCFRKVLDDVMYFTPGLNVIRGVNEASKSTRLEAIGYAWFGTQALRESLDDVVTYGQPPSALRIELDFEHAGVDYHIYRGKSGAELKFGNETVTGQTEVTKFIERLLGASAKLANKLMIARQKELSGILDEGPTAVGGLIETLANFELLDEIIDAVNSDLPAGNTKSLEGRIEGLQAASGETQLIDLGELANTEEGSAFCAGEQAQVVDALAKQIDKSLLAEANETLTQEAGLKAKLAALNLQMIAQQGILSFKVEGECPTDETIAAVEKAVNDTAGAVKLYQQYESFSAGTIPDPAWEGDLASLEAEHAKYKQLISDQRAKVNQLTLDKQTHESKLIRETSCAFCDKDLTDVPEVIQRNSHLGTKIADVASEMQSVKFSLEANVKFSDDLTKVLSDQQKVQLFYAKFGDNLTITTNVVPYQAVWTTKPSEPGTDRSRELADLKALKLKHVRNQALVEQATTQVSKLTADIASLSEAIDQLDVVQSKAIIESQNVLVQKHQVESAKLVELQRIAREAKHALELAEARNAQILETAERNKADLKKAQDELIEMQANNALIKKLREVRPKITNEIWGMVLAAVTTYFSDIREIKSVVTKDEDGFKVNGKSAKGLSGSAEDALGLAIRTSLTKTFLTNANFIILDEMAAACDARREAAMLGMIAKCGFPQVLMVTHSDQCDAYADNMIRLGE